MSRNGNRLDALEGIVAIQLHISFWIGQAKLRPEDLGLQNVPEIFHLGNKKLYPQEVRMQFTQLIGKARHFLLENSYPFVLEYVRAIPKRNLAKVMSRLEELRNEFFSAAENFLANYDSIREDMKTKYPKIWKSIEHHYPPKYELRKKFDFVCTVFEIKGVNAVEGNAPEIIEAYEKAKMELHKRYEEMVEESVKYLRKKVIEVVNNLSQRLKEQKIVRNDTIDTVRKVESWFRDLNIFGDHDVEKALTQLKNALDGVDNKLLKNNDELKRRLAVMADQVVEMASKLDDISSISGRYKRLIEL